MYDAMFEAPVGPTTASSGDVLQYVKPDGSTHYIEYESGFSQVAFYGHEVTKASGLTERTNHGRQKVFYWRNVINRVRRAGSKPVKVIDSLSFGTVFKGKKAQ